MSHELRQFNSGDDDARKLNESIVRKNPNLGLLDERIVYNKDFLLELQAKGYNPLDKEDVENYLQNLPAKNQERNIIICGADKFKYLGQGEYEERDIQKFVKKNDAGTSIKTTDDNYLSDFKGAQREMLLEKAGGFDIDLSNVELSEEETNRKDSEDILRKNMAKVFGSQDRSTPEINHNEVRGLVKSNSNISETLELIKELKALGFTADEIKQEIKLRYR